MFITLLITPLGVRNDITKTCPSTSSHACPGLYAKSLLIRPLDVSLQNSGRIAFFFEAVP